MIVEQLPTSFCDIERWISAAGERSDILIQGSRVKAGQVATLSAEGDVDLLAATSTTQESSRSKNSSASVGFSLGAQTGVTVAASAGKGHGSGQETVHSNIRIEAGEQVRIDSGGNTTLRGAVVAAPRVQARVQGELLIESLQDTSVFHEQSKQGGGSVTFGPTPGATVSAGKTKIDSNLASVGEQSAIRAGDAGFDVQVKGATDLKGGAVTSTQAAIDQGLNTFDSADGLTTSDIHNTASFSAKSSGVTVGVGSQLGSSGAGIGSDQGSASSTTQAAISGIAGNTAARTGDAETGIAPIFDKDRVRDEVEAQVAITKAFGQQAVPAWRDYANQQFEEAVKSGDEESANCWGPDGGCRAAGHALIGGLTGDVGGAAGAAASSMAAPHVQSFLMDQGLPKEAAQALTQLSALGAGAAAGNSAGAAAGLNESAHNAVVAIPLLVEGVVAGGAIAARACLSSPACLNALRLTGATLVAKVASMLDPDDLALIPGFGTAIPDPAGSNTASPAFPQAGSSSTTTPGSVLTNSGTPPREVSGYAPGSNTTISPSDTEAAGSVIVMNSNGQDLSVRLPSLVDAKGAIHILVGDKPGSGGHLWPGQPGKTPFPQSWDADTVLGVVSDVATDPASIREPAQGGRFIVRGTRNGVIVEVIIESPSRGGRIVTGYPTNLPRNTK